MRNIRVPHRGCALTSHEKNMTLYLIFNFVHSQLERGTKGHLPATRSIPVGDLLVDTVPPIPQGVFQVVKCDSKALIQVAAFKYDLHSGCSYTDSTYHSQLPPPSDSRRPIHSFVCDSGLRVGCKFLYGHPFDYTITGEVATISSAMGSTSSHGCIEAAEFEVPKC